MSSTQSLQPDPVVEEVRQVRSQLWKEAGGTAADLIRLLQTLEKKRRPHRKKAQKRAG